MKYRNAHQISGGRIDCEIDHPIYGWIPYTLDPDDTDSTVDNAALLAVIGEDFAAYVPPTEAETSALLAVEIRRDRNIRLLDVDSVAGNPLRWADLSEDVRGVWATYRQKLLDVPQQSGFPDTVVWPAFP